MRGLTALGLLWIAVTFPLVAQTDPADAIAPDPRPLVRVVEFDRAIDGYSMFRITETLDMAAEEGADLVVIRLDTPGGTVTATKDLLTEILGSEVPVVVWVAPSGAHAASAGFFLLMAADVAAMAPGTRTGASSTIVMGGENDPDDVLLKKINEDNAAMLREMATQRGRDPEVVERAVFEAKAYSQTEARELGLVDIVAPTLEALLAELDGFEVQRFNGERQTLVTADATVETYETDFRQEVFEILANPAVAFLLFTLAGIGIYLEVQSPGMIVPGVLGVLCFALFLMSSQALPVSIFGIVLIALALALFILEIKVTSYGALTAAGVVCLFLGSVSLIDGPIPELRVSPWVAAPTVVVVALFLVFAMRLIVQAHRAQVSTGTSGMFHKIGEVRDRLEPRGKVFVHGEIWDAVSESGPIEPGARIRVVGVSGMELRVERSEEEAS